MPLSVEEIRTLTDKSNDNVTAPLDHLGNKRPEYESSRRITIMEDHSLKMPELWLNVFIHGPEAGPNFYKMFARAKCFLSKTPDDADLVVFSGSGHDVNPKLYNRTAHSSTFINDVLDKSNLSLYAFCYKRGIPMMGVCGGAQILHVAQGGELYQDVDNHNTPHAAWDPHEKLYFDRISSVHHQMCVRNNKMEVLLEAHKSRHRARDAEVTDIGTLADVEAFFYRDACIIGFQGHPEYAGYSRYTVWCLEQLDKHLNENPDLQYRSNDAGSNKLRIKQELMDERNNIKTKREIIIPSAKDIIIVENTKGI